MTIVFDPFCGVSGDMILSSLLDLFPERRDDVISKLENLGRLLGIELKIELEEVKRNYLDKLKKEAERIVRREKVKGVKVNYDVEVGDPPEEILKYAEEGGYDLIVVGRRNLGRFERFLMGSISSKIVNYAKNVDVLVVEPREE